MQVEQEAAATLPKDPPPDAWPTLGGITIKNAIMRYRPGLPTTLKQVSFEVRTLSSRSRLN
jgi:ATP-binding cassette, subfamily C (CFTR/MRP), member 1